MKKTKKPEDLISRVKLKLEVTEKDGTVLGYQPAKKSKITRSVVLGKMKSAYLKVVYKTGVYNDGTFTSKDDLLKALDSWTDKQQLEYVYSGKW